MKKGEHVSPAAPFLLLLPYLPPLLHRSINKKVELSHVCVNILLQCGKRRDRVKPATVVIKKYGNRRLYDTSASRYINLDEIATLVRNGTHVKVVDAKTGEDLTRVTLTQIIVEEARDEPAGLPLELLRQLILASDKVRQEFMSWYLKSAFDSYQNVQKAVQSGLAQVGSVAMSPFESLSKLLHPTEKPQAANESVESSEVQELRDRIEQLEAQLKRKAPRNRRSTGRGAVKRSSRG
jgi:polyhydroxyalkanoate synthesis repressor PhaR